MEKAGDVGTPADLPIGYRHVCKHIYLGHNRIPHAQSLSGHNPCFGCTYNPEENPNCTHDYDTILVRVFFVHPELPGVEV
jgi:hypothetical protein